MVENKLIAEFMGFTLDTPTNIEGAVWYDNEELYLHISSEFKHSNCFKELQFHTSWDWLMPVVQKIEMRCQGVPQQLLHLSLFSTKQEVYQAVVEFINQYNN